jgi:alkanesulfonate monooxygenase SsuD/methylene tetrahydromethanopterin reductase-like flavin-dependent oxidoreductase (luciferase family)
MLAEQVEIVHRLWTEERVDFRGRHYTLEDAPAQPKPVQQPRPPLLVGGGGGRGTVEPALRFADEYNTPFVSPEDAAAIREKVRPLRFSVMTGLLVGGTRDEMRERAQELYGRRPREQSFDEWLAAYSERSVVGSVDEVVQQLREYERAGCDRMMLQHLLHTDLEPVRLIGRELAPAVA